MNLMRVLALVKSSNLIEYPTSSPNLHPVSSATLAATVVAASLRGCHSTLIGYARNKSEDKEIIPGLQR